MTSHFQASNAPGFVESTLKLLLNVVVRLEESSESRNVTPVLPQQFAAERIVDIHSTTRWLMLDAGPGYYY